MEEKKLKRFIKDGIIDLIIIGVSVAYVFYSMITIEKADISLNELCAKSILSIIAGLIIKQGLGENGFSKGYNSVTWEEEMQKYNNACNTANPYMERVDNFYYTEEIEKRKRYRQNILMGARLKYSMFFDENGDYIETADTSKLSRHQKKALKKCIRVKIYNLNLFSEYDNDFVAQTKKETNDGNQRIKMFGQNSISQSLIAVLSVYFTATWNNWNWALFIMATIQVCLWLACGVMQLYSNYNYIVIDKVNKLKKKKELIQKFVFGCEKGMYVHNPYDYVEQKEREEEENGKETKLFD